MENLEPGMLVQWPRGPGSPFGVVTAIDGPRLQVRFDGENDAMTFKARAGVITRVALEGMVRRCSTGAIGTVIGDAKAVPPRWQVVLEGQIVSVAEADLRPHKIESPQGKILEGNLGSPEQFQLTVAARRAQLDNLANDLVAMNESRVDLKPHQVGVVHRVVSNYPHRFLLCDEVGLGKTIEAGMILKELRARGAASRALVIAPPSLLRQWQFELKSKFNESFSILNSDTVKYLRSAEGFDGNPFQRYDSVIVSSKWISTPRWAKFAAEVPWDMIIVDEAHHARVRGKGRSRRETRLYKAVKQLVAPDVFSKRAALLLTATPMQLDSGELYSLIELLDPALFPTERHFDDHRSGVIGLSQLVHELGEHGAPPTGPDRDPVIANISGWLGVPGGDVENRLELGQAGVDDLCSQLSSRHLLSEILIRNRKKIIGGFKGRKAHRWEVNLSDVERTAHEAVQKYVLEGYAKAEMDSDRAVTFVMVIFQKLLASSTWALRSSLAKRREKLEALVANPQMHVGEQLTTDDLEAQLEDDQEDIDVGIAQISSDNAEEARSLGQLIELLDAIPSDSKADTLVAHLHELRTLEPDAKVLLFTEFRGTQKYLKERLEGSGWNVQLFHGQLKAEEKDLAVDAFRTATEPSILISTEAGGEGRNFQFCHLLVNYDLPWNPMRVEQRIGRVDRIGQEHEVQIFNFWVRETVEERVLTVLDSRIKIFEETVGGLDPILGETESDLRKIVQMGGEKQKVELDKLERKLERQVSKAREADERLRDFIMETKSYSREITSTLNVNEASLEPAEQERLVITLLKEVRTHLRRSEDDSYEVTFNEPFRSDFPALCDGEFRKRTVTFRADVHADSEHVEFFAPGHPVVDELIKQVTSVSFPGTASAFFVDDPALQGNAGWLTIYEINIPGFQEASELKAVFIDDEGVVDTAVGEHFLNRMGALTSYQRLPSEEVPSANLDSALEAAEAIIDERLRLLQSEVAKESQRAVEQEYGKIAQYFDYRELIAGDRLDASQKTLANLEMSIEADTRKAIPMWKARVSDDEKLITELALDRTRRLEELEKRMEPTGDFTLFAVARLVAGMADDAVPATGAVDGSNA